MPVPRIELGIALRGVATAALDVSDGLVGDLAHILERSRVGATVELPAVPRSPVLARMLANLVHSFISEILSDGPENEGNFEDGAHVQELINAVEQSFRQRRWVNIPLALESGS